MLDWGENMGASRSTRRAANLSLVGAESGGSLLSSAAMPCDWEGDGGAARLWSAINGGAASPKSFQAAQRIVLQGSRGRCWSAETAGPHCTGTPDFPPSSAARLRSRHFALAT